MKLTACLCLLAWFSGCEPCPAWAEPSDEAIAQAIYRTEGDAKTRYPYGIRSVHVSSREEAHQVCLRTIRHSRQRWHQAGNPGDFVDYLSKSYAPVGCKNDNGTNKFWSKNVRFFLVKNDK